jgi:hypothetical protein
MVMTAHTTMGKAANRDSNMGAKISLYRQIKNNHSFFCHFLNILQKIFYFATIFLTLIDIFANQFN